MAETRYRRTFTTSCKSELIETINSDANITPNLLSIVEDSVSFPGDSDFWFENPLTPSEETYFDDVLSSWICPTGSSETFADDILNIVFTREKVKNHTWLSIGDVISSNASYVIPFNATIVGVTYTSRTGQSRPIKLYVNNEFKTDIITIASGTGSDTNLNIPIDANSKIQLRGGIGSNENRDVVIILMMRLD